MNFLHTSKYIRNDLLALRNPAKAKVLARFFKTRPGEYGEGDRFLGLTVPQVRAICTHYPKLPLAEIKKLCTSPWHEVRLAAVILLANQAQASDFARHKLLARFYLANAKYINNWDLVDISAWRVVGEYLLRGKLGIVSLRRLASSSNLWERRIAIISTLAFTRAGNPQPTLAISRLLLSDEHDLIHKAVGWMLREVGKQCGLEREERFLRQHYRSIPRTTLRYAIERFPEPKRKRYLRGTLR